MSGVAADPRAAWILRVLGVQAGPLASSAAADWPAMRATWRDASDAVDQQIAALQKALRANPDETLQRIAEFGLNGVTGNHRVKLMAALAEPGPQTLDIVRKFREFLDTDEKVEVCDDNPFGVPVAIRATLCQALAHMDAALSAQTSSKAS